MKKTGYRYITTVRIKQRTTRMEYYDVSACFTLISIIFLTILTHVYYREVFQEPDNRKRDDSTNGSLELSEDFIREFGHGVDWERTYSNNEPESNIDGNDSWSDDERVSMIDEEDTTSSQVVQDSGHDTANSSPSPDDTMTYTALVVPRVLFQLDYIHGNDPMKIAFIFATHGADCIDLSDFLESRDCLQLVIDKNKDCKLMAIHERLSITPLRRYLENRETEKIQLMISRGFCPDGASYITNYTKEHLKLYDVTVVGGIYIDQEPHRLLKCDFQLYGYMDHELAEAECAFVLVESLKGKTGEIRVEVCNTDIIIGMLEVWEYPDDVFEYFPNKRIIWRNLIKHLEMSCKDDVEDMVRQVVATFYNYPAPKKEKILANTRIKNGFQYIRVVLGVCKEMGIGEYVVRFHPDLYNPQDATCSTMFRAFIGGDRLVATGGRYEEPDGQPIVGVTICLFDKCGSIQEPKSYSIEVACPVYVMSYLESGDGEEKILSMLWRAGIPAMQMHDTETYTDEELKSMYDYRDNSLFVIQTMLHEVDMEKGGRKIRHVPIDRLIQKVREMTNSAYFF